MVRFVLFSIFLVIPGLFSDFLLAQTESIPNDTPLKVGVAGSPPFSKFNQQTFEGISVELWQEIAATTNLRYEFIAQPGVKVGIDQVVAGELDILIGPVSITAERFQKVAFTQPYFNAKIGLLISGHSTSVWSRIRPIFQVAVISSVGGLFFILFIVGNLIWLAESRRNPEQFPQHYVRGVGNGMWFALVTLTTVGYGDKTPVTKTGKAITSLWMLITMVAASSLTAGIATVMTLLLSTDATTEFTQPQDIRGKQIAVVSGTTGEKWAKNYQARLLPSPNLDQAVDRLKSGQAQAVMFDVPALKYYLYQNPEAPFKIANLSVAFEDYGFVLPLDNDLIRDLNIAIIKFKQSGRLEEIIEQEIQGDFDNQ
ncbi:extracellular solute-binding protein, family 3 [Crocosphaera subtropica ATCC 51142]|uniref:Extracellular solute-binding protein, family 3 n=1 Tax=Crocosphaera subtropica (strain ATCC 51142 / BH68) TaxID=43989 RepID=B1WRB0_CROS5|nr:transporter substrate-binding domain-containing protein [Crocosphaera subtropica]ACB51759.1 extracellular solute-binding protein, family 3 [Crocosphaera subtropica ATCC 51142]